MSTQTLPVQDRPAPSITSRGNKDKAFVPFAVIAQVKHKSEDFTEVLTNDNESKYYWLVSHSMNLPSSNQPLIEVLLDQPRGFGHSIAIHDLSQSLVGLNTNFTSELPKRGRFPTTARTESGTFPMKRPKAWFSMWIQKLQNLASLSDNWDSYGAETPNDQAIYWAKAALQVLSDMEFPPKRITPSVENGVGISFISGERYGDIECFNTGEILAVTSDRQGKPHVWEVETTEQGLRSALSEIRDFLHK